LTGKRIVNISQCQNTCRQRNSFTCQTVWVAAAIPLSRTGDERLKSVIKASVISAR
jgi:hypothetical protein